MRTVSQSIGDLLIIYEYESALFTLRLGNVTVMADRLEPLIGDYYDDNAIVYYNCGQWCGKIAGLSEEQMKKFGELMELIGC